MEVVINDLNPSKFSSWVNQSHRKWCGRYGHGLTKIFDISFKINHIRYLKTINTIISIE